MAKRCSNCGASLPARTDDGVADCKYCGAQTRVGKTKRKRQPKKRAPGSASTQPAPAPAKKNKFLVYGLAGVGFACVMYFLVAGPGAGSDVSLSLVKLSEISKMAKNRSAFLDTSELVDSPGKHDALENFEWVQQFARAWAADAALTGLQFYVYADGKPTHQATVYRFISPSRKRAADELGPMTDEAPWRGFTVSIAPETVSAVIRQNAQGTADVPPITFGCTWPEMFRAAMAAPRPPKKAATYTVRILHSQRWQVRLDAGSFLDPTTCKPL